MNEGEFQELLRYQNLLARQVAMEAQTDRKIAFLTIANTLMKNGVKRIQTAALIHEAEARGFPEQEAYRLLSELERDGLLVETKQGYLGRA